MNKYNIFDKAIVEMNIQRVKYVAIIYTTN